MSAAPPDPVAGYTGRFAPSPTGELHLGSALAAIASYLDARAASGIWRVRIDDLDAPRNQAGAASAILRELERLGLDWDGPAVRQSDTPERYREALERLARDGATYPCGCSRRVLVNGRYPGLCRDGLPPGAAARAWRVRVPAHPVGLEDRVQGYHEQPLEAAIGDFVVDRADGIPAYHLATVLDDAALGVTHVVRGSDLLASTPRQRWLAQVLQLPSPSYAHVPVITHADGQKLSKQTAAPATAAHPPQRVWLACLEALDQPLEGLAPGMPLAHLIELATRRWCLARVPRARPPGPPSRWRGEEARG